MNPVRPHGAWFLLGPVFLLAGMAGAVVLVIVGVRNVDTGRQGVPVPGEALIEIAEGGEQAIYYEEPRAGQVQVPAALTISITPDGGTASMVPNLATYRSTYQVSGKAGILYGDVHLSAGRYRVKTALPDGMSVPDGSALLIGGSPVAGVIGAIFGALGVAGVSVVLAVISLVVVAVKRSRNRKMQMMQYPPMQHPPAGPPGQWPAPPPGAAR